MVNAKKLFICVALHEQDINRIDELMVSIIFVSTVAITGVALLCAWQQIETAIVSGDEPVKTHRYVD